MPKNYYISLTKPGIIFGNLITTVGGFYLAKQHHGFLLLLFTLIGISLVIASGCVFNNYIDRDIDPLMERTKNRPSATGLVSLKLLFLFGILLGVLGFLTLFFLTNTLATFVAFLGLVFYVGFYTLYFKRKSSLGTIVGSMSGAVPPVVGYCAASGTFDLGAMIIFLMLVVWQMPHSYAIAIYRLKDYAAANIPVLPVVKGVKQAKKSITIYVILFSLVSLLPTFFSYTGFYYLIVVLILNLYWLYLSIRKYKSDEETVWAKKNFLFSILVITLISIMMVLN